MSMYVHVQCMCICTCTLSLCPSLSLPLSLSLSPLPYSLSYPSQLVLMERRRNQFQRRPNLGTALAGLAREPHPAGIYMYMYCALSTF